jgi:hypothetical protein
LMPLNLPRSLSAGNTSAMELSPWFLNAFFSALLSMRLRLPRSFLIDQTSPPSLSGAELRDRDNFC